MNHLLSSLFILLCAVASLSCMNMYMTKLDGTVDYTSLGPVIPNPYIPEKEELQADSTSLWNRYAETDSIEYLSDYAATLVFLGHYEEAKSWYHTIEQSHPELYTTASNLGTIYELIGMPDSALIWIKKSMDLNPDSHGGSEWIHVKILEFRLSGSEDYSRSILGLNFGDGVMPVNIENIDLPETKAHIYHQLEERLKFIAPENKIVGNIYFDLGNILALTEYIESALECYAEARRFGFESPLMDKRIAEFEKMAEAATAANETPSKTEKPGRDNFRPIVIVLISISIPVLLLVGFLIKRTRDKKHQGS